MFLSSFKPRNICFCHPLGPIEVLESKSDRDGFEYTSEFFFHNPRIPSPQSTKSKTLPESTKGLNNDLLEFLRLGKIKLGRPGC